MINCIQCFKPIVITSHSKQKFCNLKCSNVWINAHASERAEKKSKGMYLAQPPKCAECNNNIPYDKNGDFKRKKFCNHSCSATHANKKSPKRKISPENLMIKLKPKICIRKNMSESQAEEIMSRRTQFYVNLLFEGKLRYRNQIRNALIKTNGYKCSICSLSEWDDKPIPLQVDHIDGNAGNNLPHNLRLLCPNCHAQTPTHKGKNKGKGRGSRNLGLS